MASRYATVRFSHRQWWLVNNWRVVGIWWHYSFGWKSVCDIHMFGPELSFPRTPAPPSGYDLN